MKREVIKIQGPDGKYHTYVRCQDCGVLILWGRMQNHKKECDPEKAKRRKEIERGVLAIL